MEKTPSFIAAKAHKLSQRARVIAEAGFRDLEGATAVVRELRSVLMSRNPTEMLEALGDGAHAASDVGRLLRAALSSFDLGETSVATVAVAISPLPSPTSKVKDLRVPAELPRDALTALGGLLQGMFPECAVRIAPAVIPLEAVTLAAPNQLREDLVQFQSTGLAEQGWVLRNYGEVRGIGLVLATLSRSKCWDAQLVQEVTLSSSQQMAIYRGLRQILRDQAEAPCAVTTSDFLAMAVLNAKRVEAKSAVRNFALDVARTAPGSSVHWAWSAAEQRIELRCDDPRVAAASVPIGVPNWGMPELPASVMEPTRMTLVASSVDVPLVQDSA